MVQARADSLPKWQQDLGKRLLLRRVGEAYGRMVLGPGLFQADCHPGNILVSDTGHVGEACRPDHDHRSLQHCATAPGSCLISRLPTRCRRCHQSIAPQAAASRGHVRRWWWCLCRAGGFRPVQAATACHPAGICTAAGEPVSGRRCTAASCAVSAGRGAASGHCLQPDPAGH